MSLRPSGSRISRLSSSPSLLLIAEAFPAQAEGARLRGQTTIADGSRHDCLRVGSAGVDIAWQTRRGSPTGASWPIPANTATKRPESRPRLLQSILQPSMRPVPPCPHHPTFARTSPSYLATASAGRFLIAQELGRGGAGTVFIAQERTLGRAVAIKVLTHAPDAHALARFAQEARAAGALEHPNVLALHDVGVHEGVPFIVSELLRGRTLRARLAEGPLQAPEATDLALQLARGLAATHEHGILHRDLKPENLFLLEDGRLKIVDFGLAKLLPSVPAGDRDADGNLATVSGAILGTVPYMSPEQVRGRPADARSLHCPPDREWDGLR